MEASFYWSAYMMQMLAIDVADASGRHDLVPEYTALSRDYIDKHFEAIDRHLNNLREFYNG